MFPTSGSVFELERHGGDERNSPDGNKEFLHKDD